MTIEELLDRIEEIKSSLENADDPHGIEGAVYELFILITVFIQLYFLRGD